MSRASGAGAYVQSFGTGVCFCLRSTSATLVESYSPPLSRLTSASVLTVSKEDARRFFVRRQMLAPPRSVEGGPGGVLEALRRLGSVQFDPIAVAGRNHDLVLHARVAGYEPAWVDSLNQRRDVFEAYNKGPSLVPTSEFPWFRGNFALNARRVLAEHPDVAEHVLE